MTGSLPVPDPEAVIEDELASYRRALARAAARVAEDEPADPGPEPQLPDAA
jgi:hypothetical protein